MPPTHHTEIERKFDVPCDGVVPDLRRIHGVHALGPTATFHLAADYWDTPRLDLARRHITLRRRTGGNDAGWHLKVGAGPDARAEHASELGDAHTPPDALLALVRDVVGEHPLHVVARVDARRDETPMLDRSGAVLARFCDDLVVADTPPAPSAEHPAPQPVVPPARPDPALPATTQWREWEVELADGDRTLLAATSAALLAGGAHHPAFSSKLAHALADRLEPSPRSRKGRQRRPSTTDVLRRRLHTQLDALEAQTQGVGAGDATAIHDMRIAARRLRAALRTFEPVLETGATRACSRELRWLGLVLGTARDAQVLRERLVSELAALAPPSSASAPSATAAPTAAPTAPSGPLDPLERHLADERIGAHLEALTRTGHDAAASAVASARYRFLLDDLEVLAAHPPARPEAASRATAMVPGLLARDARRLLRASRRAQRALPPGRDGALHETRKRAKQLRYSAESASDVCGKSARKVAKAATRVQASLGDHQDAVVARDLLRTMTTQARQAGEGAAAYDALRRVELAAAASAVDSYEVDLRHLRKVLRRRLRGLQLAHP
ncbi:MAG: CYTH and CHAD domain-containing protein [Actinomycetota bacterium]|nr:CYTH and CHAD domain-containing protein [Actinomycetota bacterium]